MSVVFLDCETTGLDPRRHVPWEVAIVEPDGTEHVWCWRPAEEFMAQADQKALDIGRFRERAPLIRNAKIEQMAASEVHRLLEGNVIVGSNPHFDVTMLTAWLYDHGRDWNAHYRPVCAVTMAAGWLRGRNSMMAAGGFGAELLEEPWRSYDISRACDVEPPSDDAHQALADASWVKRLYERITGAA